MASILQVETLQGPTSGVNANKITIPAGQTLDIDAWTPPAGTCIQVQQVTTNFEFTNGSTSWTDSGFYIDITPKSASTAILVFISGGRIRVNTTSDEDALIAIRRNDDIITSNNISRIGSTTATTEFPLSHAQLDTSHNTTSTIRYKVYTRKTTGSATFNINNGSAECFSITAMEFSQ
jgi:hypothetical protein